MVSSVATDDMRTDATTPDVSVADRITRIARLVPSHPRIEPERWARLSGSELDTLEQIAADIDGPTGLRFVQAGTVDDEIPEWAWEYLNHGRILKGALTLFGGRPAAGKSTTARWFAAGWANGTLPGCWLNEPVNVAYIATEEHWKHTVVPSLKAAGADMKLVFFIQRDGEPARITATRDEVELTAGFLANEIRVVVLDPLMSEVPPGWWTSR